MTTIIQGRVVRRSTIARAIFLATVAGTASIAAAQDNADSTRDTAAPPVDQPVNIRPASQPVNIGVELGGGYDDNIYATRNHEQGDFYLLARPFARADLGSGGNTLTLRGEGEIGRYADHSSENYDDWLLASDWRGRLTRNLTLLGGAEWRWAHENRASPEAVSGLTPTQYRRKFGYLGLLGSLGDFRGRVAGTVTRYNFDDVATVGGTINNHDRNRLQSEIGARGGVVLKSGTELFVQGAYDWRDYDDRLDDFGYARNSEGFSLAAGVSGKLGKNLTGEVFAGWLRQNYSDVRLRDISTFDVGATLDWVGNNGLGGSFRLDRSVEETTLPGSSGYIVTSARIGLRKDANARLSAGMGLSGTHYEYIGGLRTEFVIGGDIWARYWLNRHIYFRADYSHAERSSNAAGFDYNQNRFQLSIGAQLKPGFSADAAPVKLAAEVPAGAYAGVLAGYGTLVTGLDGPRGNAGSNTADFGDHGAGAAAVAGYGVLVNSLYLGVEAEASLRGPDWLHTASRVYSMDKRDAFGLAARVGVATPNHDLIYGRFGWSSAAIRTDYTHNAHDHSETDRLTGLGGGVGIEAPAGKRGFLRAEYVVTSYNDIDVPTGGGNFDNMSADETQFRLGGGVRFGHSPQDSADSAPVKFGGPYIGVQLGHGALVTSNQGIRSGDTALDVTRASQGGLLGIYAGYGTLLKSVYLGVEAEGDITAIDWNIERDPTGRVYSAQHDYSFGASARAGVRIGGSALLYGRVGAVRTRFDVRFETNNASVRATDTRTGLRYGAGLEIGLGESTRLRGEYTLTDYSAYDVEYGRNSDRFDHSEALFRLGLAWRL
jgi:opacity protein-like surface antigen